MVYTFKPGTNAQQVTRIEAQPAKPRPGMTAVLPADEQIDLDLLKSNTNAKKAVLATEDQFRNLFPQCETGAMPPFGNLYGQDVYVEESLTADETIAFNAGSHSELIQLNFSDFKRLVKPKVVRMSTRYI